MDVVANYSDYLERRLSGEHVRSAATMYGITALKQIPELKEFGIVSLAHDTYMSYIFHVVNGKFRVTESYESIFHGLSEYLSPDLLNDQIIKRWWNCVFYEQGGQRFYDAAYDNLSITENSIITFKDIIHGTQQVLSKIVIPKQVSLIMLTGEIGSNPLIQYVLQDLHKSLTIIELDPMIECAESIDENKYVYIPQRELDKYTFCCNQNIEISSLVSRPIKFTIPLDQSKESIMLANLKWKDILIDEKIDYSVCNLDFKQILLSVNFDSFCNLFAVCEDMCGHRKVVKIN